MKVFMILILLLFLTTGCTEMIEETEIESDLDKVYDEEETSSSNISIEMDITTEVIVK